MHKVYRLEFATIVEQIVEKFFREVQAQAAQWRIGGAPTGTNHTRILDVAWPAAAAPTQEQFLSAYPPSQAAVDSLTADDFAQVPMILP